MADLATPPLSPSAGGQPGSQGLKRSLGLRDLTVLFILTTLSIRWIATAAAAGPGTLLVWVGGLLCFFLPLATSVLALGTRFPEEGGIYVWTREAFGDRTAFVTAWTYWMSNLPYFPGILYFGASTLLVAFGPRGHSLAGSAAWHMGFAVFWLAVIVALNIRGIEAGKWLNNICSVGNWLPVVILVLLAAAVAARYGSATHFTRAAFVPHLTLRDAVFWSTIVFAFSGCEAGSMMGDEIHDAKRTLPRALFLAGLIVAIAYIAGTAAMLVALPSHAVSGLDGFIGGIAQLCDRLSLSWLSPIVAVLVALSAVGGAAAYLAATSRLPFVAGLDRCLPTAFGAIHRRYRTPWVAILVYGLAGIVVAILGQAGTSVRGAYDVLVSLTIITTFLPFLLLFAALIRLAFRGAITYFPLPGGRPLAITLAAIGFLATAATIVLSAIPSPEETSPGVAIGKVLLSALVIVVTGMAVFAVGRRSKILPR
ncbi:MAG TPA: APC family permease [Acidobacteriaceae bacterium]